jgi:Outer membrane protein beta-barrel domain
MAQFAGNGAVGWASDPELRPERTSNVRFSKFASLIIGAATVVLASSAAYAQGIQKPEVGVGYQYGSAKQSGDDQRTNFPGGFYVDFSGELPVKSMPVVWRWIGQIDGSFKGSEGSEESIKLWGYGGGVNFGFPTSSKVNPYGQVMIGGGHVSQGSFSANGFQFDIEGGAKFPISGKISGRAGVVYRRLQLSDDNGGGVNIIGFRGGVVIPVGQ